MAVGRGAAALLSGALLCALVAGCTTADPERGSAEPGPSSPSSGAPPEPATVTLGVYGPEPMLEAYDAVARAFTDENPQVTVKVRAYDDAEDVMASIQGGHPPDVFLMDHDHVPRLVQEELVRPLDGLLEARRVDFGDGYQRGGLTAFAANAALQCMPHDVSPQVVYYNRDLVDLRRLRRQGEEPPPSALDGWTWEMFAAAAHQAARGPEAGVYIEPSLDSIAPFIWSAGGEIVDDLQAPTTLTLSDGTSRDALEQVLALVRDPEVTLTPRELEKHDAVTRFSRGGLGMIVGTRALTPQLRAAEDLRFDVMPLPNLGRLRTSADVNGYCISSDTEVVDAAADFVAFAVGRQGAAITARTGYVVPSNLEIANSAAFAQTSRQPASSFVFNEGVRRAQTMPFAPAWPQLAERVESPLYRMFYAPVIDLDVLLEEIDRSSAQVLAPGEE